jgi:hypothetical protein
MLIELNLINREGRGKRERAKQGVEKNLSLLENWGHRGRNQ